MWERGAAIGSAARLLDAARHGAGGALFLIGEPGLGKSAVLDECTALAAPYFTLGIGRGDPMETLLPFGLMEQAFEGLGAEHLLEPTLAAESGADRRAAAFYAVLRWFNSQTGPMLCAIDDLHWADDDSLAMFSFLCRRLTRLPLVLIGTLRPWPRPAHELAERLAQSGNATTEYLKPLGEHASGDMLAARVGGPLTQSLCRQAWVLTGGNPLLLEHLAHVISQGEELPEAVPGSLGVGAEMLLSRFAGLPPGGMLFAQAASVLGVRFRLQVAAEVGQLSEREADVYLEALWRLGLVQDSGVRGAVEFAHPLFRQALYADLGSPVRARLHAKAFEALMSRGATMEAAQHAIRAGLTGNARAIETLQEVGRAALRRGAFAVATEHLAAATELSGDRSDPQLKLSLAEALLSAGRSVEAVPVCRSVLDSAGESVRERIQALRLLGRGLFATGEHQQASACFEEAAPLAREHDLDAAVQILVDHALSSWLTAGPSLSLPLARRARGLAATASDQMRRRAEATWGFVALHAGDAGGFEATAAAGEPVASDPMSHLEDVCSIWSPLTTYGVAATNTERFDTAERVFKAGLAAAESVGAGEAVASLRIVYGLNLLTRLGRLDEALRLVEAASELFDIAPVAEAYAAAGRALILQLMGRLDESLQWCGQTELLARRRGEWVALLLLWDVQGHRHLREGRLAEAVDSYTRLERATERLGIGEPCLVPWARHAIGAYLAASRSTDALRVIGWLEECAARLPCSWPRIAALTGRAALDALEGDGTSADARFQAALTLHRGRGLRTQEIETLLLYGGFLRRSGQVRRSRAVLAEAARVADAAGARWLGLHAQNELRVAGGRRRQRREPERLTPQEERVAELASAGLSNKEIAQQLWLAVSTVETHLHQVYGKLGIRSRRQLMARSAIRRTDG